MEMGVMQGKMVMKDHLRGCTLKSRKTSNSANQTSSSSSEEMASRKASASSPTLYSNSTGEAGLGQISEVLPGKIFKKELSRAKANSITTLPPLTESTRLGHSDQHSPLDSEAKSSADIIRNVSNSNGITGPNTKVLSDLGKDSEVSNSIASTSSSGPTNARRRHCSSRKGCFINLTDITKGAEKVKISLADDPRNEHLPAFNYIPHNIIYQSAHVQISLARIADEDCCSSCMGDCLSSELPCACARETGGEFAYTPVGQLKEEFLESCKSLKVNPQEKDFVYCQDCPIERSRNDSRPEKCKGHLIRKFIKECWRKCGCDMHCGNRVVQRGITCKLQVFLTEEGKGWGVRTLEELPKGTFVCEYVGEIVTNTELYDRNMQKKGRERHTYPVMLDADWGSEGHLQDEEALCLDATYHGNVARFINHRCFDANLIDIPVEVETPDRHYYHIAFFTARKVGAFEELNWDYGIDFDDKDHPVKAFKCCCKSSHCRDMKRRK
ncbi:histone-lysine N-methyltransferase SUVR4 isoform X2 [Eucalyptus grandis]|uniref:histone-lysine N-methyltransferase SUVR4 isoform X2 n=1 Tax=Eucalyptus grandis TaxID=71139 RepID=UPI00192EBCC4|nr:histone-lysine N-methyltransferase SUVR4 isoform X2 [Eucalyptus grandis]